MLHKTDFQYQITFHSPDAFLPGQMVFFKSNPAFPMRVVNTSGSHVSAEPLTTYRKVNSVIGVFRPETLLQYRYAALLIYKGMYNICLN